MMRPALLLLLSLAACAAAPAGDWPSLALRPGEVQPLVARPVGSAAQPQPAPIPDAARDMATREASLARDVAQYEKRLRAQLADTAAASGKAGADAEATAQLELTRLDRLGNQATDLRDRYNELTGDLARSAAAGTDVTASLARLGNGIDKVEALHTEQRNAYATAQAALKKP